MVATPCRLPLKPWLGIRSTYHSLVAVFKYLHDFRLLALLSFQNGCLTGTHTHTHAACTLSSAVIDNCVLISHNFTIFPQNFHAAKCCKCRNTEMPKWTMHRAKINFKQFVQNYSGKSHLITHSLNESRWLASWELWGGNLLKQTHAPVFVYPLSIKC